MRLQIVTVISMKKLEFSALVSEVIAGICLLGFIGLCQYPTPSIIANVCIGLVLGVVFGKQLFDIINIVLLIRLYNKQNKEDMKNVRRKENNNDGE